MVLPQDPSTKRLAHLPEFTPGVPGRGAESSWQLPRYSTVCCADTKASIVSTGILGRRTAPKCAIPYPPSASYVFLRVKRRTHDRRAGVEAADESHLRTQSRRSLVLEYPFSTSFTHTKGYSQVLWAGYKDGPPGSRSAPYRSCRPDPGAAGSLRWQTDSGLPPPSTHA